MFICRCCTELLWKNVTESICLWCSFFQLSLSRAWSTNLYITVHTRYQCCLLMKMLPFENMLGYCQGFTNENLYSPSISCITTSYFRSVASYFKNNLTRFDLWEHYRFLIRKMLNSGRHQLILFGHKTFYRLNCSFSSRFIVWQSGWRPRILLCHY